MSTAKPSPEALVERFKTAGIRLTSRQSEQFWAYHRHLRARNTDLNMTRIYEFEAMVLKLYLDSALVGKLTALPSPLLDIGTGPGFPGIPLAILHPDIKFLLSEGRHKRNEFLQEVVNLLGLDNVEVLGHRIAPDFERPVRGVITRAVESIPETLFRVLRCLAPGGKAIFMKGPDCDEEIKAAEKLAKYYQATEDHDYRLLDTDNLRRLVVYKRTAVPAPQPARGTLVTSPDNARLKLAKRLTNSRQIRKSELTIAPMSSAREIMELEPHQVEQILAREGAVLPSEAAGLPAMVVSPDLYDDALPGAAGSYCALIRVPHFGSASVTNPQLVFDIEAPVLVLGLTDPAELGAAVRAAVISGWRRIVLTRESAHPFHPDSIRRAGAAVYQAEFHDGPAASELVGHQDAYRIAGPAALPAGVKYVFLGRQTEPAWPIVGGQAELELEPGALLAVVLFEGMRAQTRGQDG